ncbi:MAG: putative toxin-antitoxin system toxin component, PIN family [Snowella sp.]|nr:MAG: putative toxin-antitoxin system toxin component, PIN family [Snowella sp.]
MSKLQFVIDTNVLVSSILIKKSSSDFVLKKVRSLGTLLFSEATFQELQTTLSRSKFDRYVSLQVRSEFIFRLRLESELVEIVERIDLCRDEKDNKFLEVAINGKADYLITGDNDLLVLRPFQDVKIMTVTANFVQTRYKYGNMKKT